MNKKWKLFISIYIILIIILGFFESKSLIDNYKEIVTASLAFIGTVIALFVTLTALPIQNILGKYSQDLVKKIGNDQKLTRYLLVSLIIFGFNFSVFIMPIFIFILLSYVLTMVYLVILFFYINRVFYLLDTRNHVKEISEKLREDMNSTRSNQYKSAELEWLKETDIIIDIIQKSIQENRFEIVDSGFKDIESIVRRYLQLYRYFNSDENYLNYILDNLVASKGLVSKNSHPRIIKSIANCSGNLAKRTYEINNSYMNYISRGFVDLLVDIILSHEMVKETSNMPLEACDQLVDIGKTAIYLEDPITAVNISKKLGNINRIATTQMKNLRGDLIARYMNWGIALLLKYSLENLDKIENEKYILEDMINEINLNVTAYSKDEFIHSDINISTLTGFLPESIPNIANIIINKIEEDQNVNDLFLLQKLYGSLNFNIKNCIKTKKDSSAIELLNNTYTIGIELIKLITKIKDENLKEIAKNLLENTIFSTLYEIMLEYLKNNRSLHEALSIYFSFMGVMFFENNANNEFYKILEKHISEVVKTFSEIEDIHPENYSYMRLMGSWALKWNINRELLENIKDIIKIQDDLISKKNAMAKKIFPDIDGNKYSKLFTRKTIMIPVLKDYPKGFEAMNNELFNEDNRKNFEKYLKED